MDIDLPPPALLVFMAASIALLGSIALAIVRRRFSIRLMLVATTAACVAAALLNHAFGPSF